MPDASGVPFQKFSFILDPAVATNPSETPRKSGIRLAPESRGDMPDRLPNRTDDTRREEF